MRYTLSNTWLKQDINFLEYPLWMQDSQAAEQNEEGVLWKDREGFIYRAGYKPPVKVDYIFLLYLLLKSQKNGWNEQVTLSRFELLKECQVGTSTYWYQRLEDSLKRWKMMAVEFQGIFFDSKKYLSMNFGVVDSWNLEEETKELKVRFSTEWLLRIKNSNFFKMIDFEQVKALRSPLAIRLYEILSKSFHGRLSWEISADKLAEKIPMQATQVAHIILKIKAAVNRINENTDFRITLKVKRPHRGKASFIFYKQPDEQSNSSENNEITNPAESPSIWDIPQEGENSLLRLLDLLPTAHKEKKTVIEMVSEALRKHGEEYTRRNIEYANQQSKKNYRGFLLRALKEDWAEDEPVLCDKNSQNEKREVSEKKEVRLSLKEFLGLSENKVDWSFEEVMGYVREDERNNENVQFLVWKALKEQGAEYSLWNILYANRCSTGGHYDQFLKICFQNNHGTNNPLLFESLSS